MLNKLIKYGTITKNVHVVSTGGLSIGRYDNLKLAFDAINNGTHTGSIDVKINKSFTQTTNTAIYQSGYSGSGGISSYTDIEIYPTKDNLSITYNISGGVTSSLFLLVNGVSVFAIDGRVNKSGNRSLKFVNNGNNSLLKNSPTASISNISLNYCIIDNTNSTVEDYLNIYLSSTLSGNNYITYNKFINNPTVQCKNIVTYNSTGSTHVSNNEFDNCMFCVRSTGVAYVDNNDIYFSSNCSSSITSNVLILMAEGNVANNRIGGKELGGGSINASINYISATSCYIISDKGISSTDNTIELLDITISSNNASLLLYHRNTSTQSQNINISNINILASNNINIYISGSLDTSTVRYNNAIFDTITITNSNNSAVTNIMILGSPSTYAVNITNSTVRNITITETTGRVNCYGILLYGNATHIIDAITINDIYNYSTHSSSCLIGALIISGTISQSQFYNLKTKSTNTNSGNYTFTDLTTNSLPALAGIMTLNKTSDVNKVLTRNAISVLENTNSSASGTTIIGIYHEGVRSLNGTSNNYINANFIASLNFTSTNGNTIIGIESSKYTGILFTNNIIYIGGSNIGTIYGVKNNSEYIYTSEAFYYNDIQIYGVPSSGTYNSYCIYHTNNYGDINQRCNILENRRSGNGNHYCSYHNYSTVIYAYTVVNLYSAGSGTPTGTPAEGSIHFRTATSGTGTIYTYTSGAWDAGVPATENVAYYLASTLTYYIRIRFSTATASGLSSYISKYNSMYVDGTNGYIGYYNSSNKTSFPIVSSNTIDESNNYTTPALGVGLGSRFNDASFNPLDTSTYGDYDTAHTATSITSVPNDYNASTRNSPYRIGSVEINN